MSEAQGAVALVTGAAGGIGATVARALTVQGMRVAVGDIDEDRATAVAREIDPTGRSARGWAMDVTDRAAVERVVAAVSDSLGPVHVLVNNAGFADQTGLLDMEPEQWQREFDVIVSGAIHCSRAVLPSMMQDKRGAIINIGSVNGLAFYSHPTYSAAKAALFSLTHSMAALYGANGVRVNAVAPGTIATPIWDVKLEENRKIFDALTPYIPLGTIGRPDHVADAVCFLASDRAAHITGVILPVDGGLATGILPMAHHIHGTS